MFLFKTCKESLAFHLCQVLSDTVKSEEWTTTSMSENDHANNELLQPFGVLWTIRRCAMEHIAWDYRYLACHVLQDLLRLRHRMIFTFQKEALSHLKWATHLHVIHVTTDEQLWMHVYDDVRLWLGVYRKAIGRQWQLTTSKNELTVAFAAHDTQTVPSASRKDFLLLSSRLTI